MNGKEIDALYDAIAHGDEDHRDWLKEALEAHFAGKPVPPPQGLNESKAVEQERKRCAEIVRGFLAGDELEYLQMVNRIATAIENPES